MRNNSFLPIIGVLVVCIITIPLALRGPARGSGGPAVDPGVFRRVTNGVYQVTSMPLHVDNQVTAVDANGQPLASPPALGLDVARFVVLSGEDRSPLTAAVLRGLAEEITARGGAAILDPMPLPGGDTDHVLALGANWRLAVETVSGAPPETPGGDCSATVRFTLTTIRLPPGHPAAQFQDAGRALSTVLQVTHRSHAEQPSSDWPAWYAAFGRSLGDTVLDMISAGVVSKPDLDSPDWGSSLPQPSMVDVMRWSAAFQQQLLRGWVGRINGLATIGPDGRSLPSLDRLKSVLAHGDWKPVESTAPGYLMWTRETDGGWLAVHSDPGGHDVSLWWERPQAADLFTQWLSAAVSGAEPALERQARLADAGSGEEAPSPEPVPAQEQAHARACLAAYQDCTAIPESYRRKAKALLAAPLPTPAGAPAAP